MESETSNTFKVAALYHFTQIDDVPALKAWLTTIARNHQVLGMLILAREGINGTIAAECASMDAFLNELRSDSRFSDLLSLKFSYANSQPFYHMRLSIRKEIVTMGIPEFVRKDCEEVVMVDPTDWNSVISKEDVVVVDTRNDYEYNLGTFAKALNPDTRTFGEFPKYAAENLNKDAPIAMFCTGGIRCEKAASYLAQQGFKKVYNLKGGILKYLEDVDEKDSMWKGECFVFDQRVSVTHGLRPGHSKLCRGCRHPLTPEDRNDEHHLEGIHCKFCYNKLTPEQIAAAKERDHQIQLAKQRNEKHLGFVPRKKVKQCVANVAH